MLLRTREQVAKHPTRRSGVFRFTVEPPGAGSPYRGEAPLTVRGARLVYFRGLSSGGSRPPLLRSALLPFGLETIRDFQARPVKVGIGEVNVLGGRLRVRMAGQGLEHWPAHVDVGGRRRDVG